MKIVCNIPHAGATIPDWALADFTVAQSDLARLVNKLVDQNVDALFSFVADEGKVVSNIARIVVDMERYRDDAAEPMSKLGMGLFYEKDDEGRQIRHRGATYDKCLALYDEYHSELESKVQTCVEETGHCYVIDCHSFHDEMHHTDYPTSEYPDVCLGINEETPAKEVVWVKDLFKRNGYSVKYNVPFAGSLVPLKYFGDSRVKSIMIELNRRIYCNNADNFRRVQNLCKEVYLHLSKQC